MFFNRYVSKIKPYQVSSHKAWDNTENVDVLKLDWNESTIPPSPIVLANLSKYLIDGRLNWYPNVNNLELRANIAIYSNVSVDNVEYFASSDALHEYIIRVFINPNDNVTMIGPTYDNFRAVCESSGANIDMFTLDAHNDFKFNLNTFVSHIETSRPKIVYLCNPNNPTGTIFKNEEIEFLVKRFNDVMFIVDEAYYEFTGVSSSPLVNKYENIIVSRTFSKAFGLASFRIGYCITSKNNIDGLRRIRNSKNISSLAQIAANSSFLDVNYMKDYVAEVKKSKTIFIDKLKVIGVPVFGSIGGNYVLVNFGINQDFVVSTLEANNIYVRNYGHVNGMSEYTRITVGTEAQMSRVLSCISNCYFGIS